MMMTRLQFAFGVVLAFVRFASGEESLEDMPLEDLVDHFISTFDRNMHEGHAAQMLGASERRLAAGDAETKEKKAGAKKEPRAVGTIPDVTYATICAGNCWTALKDEFTESLKVMDSSSCKTKKNKEKVEKVKTDRKGAKEKIEKKETSDEKRKKAAGGEKKADDKKAGGEGEKKAGDDKKAGGEGEKKAGDAACARKAGDEKKACVKKACEEKAGANAAAKTKCAKPRAAGGRRLPAAKPREKAVKKESDCIFDLCAVPQVVTMCTGNATGNFSFDKFELDDCKKASAMFICKSVCSASCKDNADMKKLICGKTGKEGKFDTDAGGGSLKKMFNGICSKNADSKYCYDLIKTDLAADKYAVAVDKAKEGKMPDPCATDCTSPLGKSVIALGCCFPTLMEVQKKYNIVKREQARFTKATAVKCAKDTAFAACKAGQLTKTKSKQFQLNISGSCDNLGTESAEDAFATSMSDQLNLTAGDVEVLTCKTRGKKCDKTRRLGEERQLADDGSEVDVNVQVSGEDADAQMTALAAQMDSGLAATLTATAEEMADGEVAEAAIDTAATSTGDADSAMVASALHRRVSSFASAVVLGSAWLGQ